MIRRDFLTRLGLLTAAAVTMDPLELIERLAPRRLYVPGTDFAAPSHFGVGVRQLDDLMRRVYADPVLLAYQREDAEAFAKFAHVYDPSLRVRTP